MSADGASSQAPSSVIQVLGPEGRRRMTFLIVSYLQSPASPPISMASLAELVRQVLAVSAQLSTPCGPIAEIITQSTIARSISRDALISFEDGKPYRRLRRHLAARGLTAEAYRRKWELPDDYPMVCADYSEEVAARRRPPALRARRR